MKTYRKRVIIIAALAVVTLGASFAAYIGNQNVPAANGQEEETVASGREGGAKTTSGMVFISGAVNHPGLYPLSGQQRVNDVLALAGGLTADADLSKVNLAQKVKDGMHVNVPTLKTPRQKASSGGGTQPLSGDLPQGSVDNSATVPVSINGASGDELAAVNGIGPALAERIVVYRQEHGPFASIEELRKVKGIGARKLNKLRNQLTL